jgi:4-aminobutyrate aminotransferase-like enzyme
LKTFDEMQAGFGRTGLNFGYEHYGVTPDLICTGKGMGGGLPLSGVLGRSSIMDLPEVGNMSSTHSASPLVCAAGLAVIEELESKNLVNEASRKGKVFRGALESLQKLFPDHISWVLGEGMIMALLFHNPETGKPDGLLASKVAERCMQRGVLVVHTGRESIKLGPPLTIPEAALLEGVSVLSDSIAEVLSE